MYTVTTDALFLAESTRYVTKLRWQFPQSPSPKPSSEASFSLNKALIDEIINRSYKNFYYL